jgi:site-specific DNA recombinase
MREAMSTHLPANTTRAKRAFSYLRVSSEGQVNTDYVRDGLSIEVQRDKRDIKAAELGAEIVEEFPDPGKSAFVDLHKRKEFLRMLDKLKEYNANSATFIDYVIFLDLSRFARNAEDHFRCRRMIMEAGARFISIYEPMVGEDTPEAFLFEGQLAVNNQYESMKISRRAREGLRKKASFGGTFGWTRLGYVNDIDRLPDGRRVAMVSTDPKRCEFMTYAFKLYATGEYSTAQLTDELYRLGLRSRPRKNHPAQKVTTASVHRILRDPYYAGWIVYKRGKPNEEVFKGRHEALIDQETFDKVQVLLDEKRVAGERPRKRQHYLRGSIFCAGCGSRLTYGISTGENGRKYAYYFCASRVNRTTCTERRANLRPELVEAALERMYAEHPIEMTPERVARSKAAIRGMVEVSQESLAHVRDLKTELIVKLKAQQTRLLRLYAEEGDDTSPDAFRAERARMQAEIKEAEKSLAETETRLRINEADLYRALELAEDVAAFYRATDDKTRRGYNQAFFKHIWIKARWDDEAGRTLVEVAGVELTDPYALLLAEETTEEALAWVEAIKAGRKPQKAGKRLQKPHLQLPKALSGDDISIYEVLAGSSGRVANRDAQLETLVQLLMESAGRQARRRAVETIRRSKG